MKPGDMLRATLAAIVVLVCSASVSQAQVPPPPASAGSPPAVDQQAPRTAPVTTGARKGFVIGFGAGYGITNWKEMVPTQCRAGYYYCTTRDTEGRSGVFTNFKIGYAPNNRLMILWHSANVFFGSSAESGFITDGIGGGSLQFYLSDKTPSVYVLGGAGYHNIMHFSSESLAGSNTFAFGIRGGAGFEFARHWAVEGLVQHSFNAAEGRPTSVGVSLNWLWY
jgi:hypothetical protein